MDEVKRLPTRWDSKISPGKFRSKTFDGQRAETPHMDAANVVQVFTVLQNQEPVYRNARTAW